MRSHNSSTLSARILRLRIERMQEKTSMIHNRAVNPAQDDKPIFTWVPFKNSLTLSLPEQIAERIGNAIIRGEYAPGEKVPEVEVATEFGVSRSPVREALRILEREGLVQIHPRKGAQVTNLSIAEIEEMFTVRGGLLGLAARLITERQDPEVLDALKQKIKRLNELASTNQSNEFLRTVYELSILVSGKSNNTVLDKLISSLAHQTLRYTMVGLSTIDRRKEVAKDWVQFLKAFEEKNGIEAHRLTEKLIRDVRDSVIQRLSSESMSTTGKKNRK